MRTFAVLWSSAPEDATENVNRTVSGADLSNPQIHTSSFLIEVVFKTVPGLTDATLIQKMNDVGWALVRQPGRGRDADDEVRPRLRQSREPCRRQQRPVAPS